MAQRVNLGEEYRVKSQHLAYQGPPGQRLSQFPQHETIEVIATPLCTAPFLPGRDASPSLGHLNSITALKRWRGVELRFRENNAMARPALQSEELSWNSTCRWNVWDEGKFYFYVGINHFRVAIDHFWVHLSLFQASLSAKFLLC